ncbi:MAG: CPBP family intramembrane glutamic endopeptidase [Desulfosalsimonadaceae bacterium]
MDPAARPGFRLILAAFAAVGVLEISARWLPVDPVLATGFVRIMDIVAVAVLCRVFLQNPAGIGLARDRLLPGISAGIVWSAGFGAAVCAAGALLLALGEHPLSLLRTRMPEGVPQLVLFFLVGGVVGPAAEELLYRGLLYSFLRKWGIFLAVGGSTLLFVLSHGTGQGLSLTRIAGGIIFCLAYERSKSLAAPLVIHILGNTAIFTLTLAVMVS